MLNLDWFSVAYKRFTDLVPLAIDHDFIFGIERDIESALYSGQCFDTSIEKV